MRVDDATGISAHCLPPGSDGRSPSIGYRLRMCGPRQSQSADPSPRTTRRWAGCARPQYRLDRQRSCVLFGRAEVVERRPDQYLVGEIGVRRHRISAVRRLERGQQAWNVIQSYGRASELEAARRFGSPRQRRYRTRAMTLISQSSIRTKASWCARANRNPCGPSPFEGVELTGG